MTNQRLWMLKNTILEFFKRLSGLTWSRSYQTSVGIGRCVLIVTFIAVVISDLAECQPFSHYWQVSPDPGAQCRQGYANLITNGVCNVLTDVLLVALPVPIILRSQMTFKRKAQLVLLFSMSLLVVAVTLYRLPKVISAHGSQQLRSVIASVELLVATSVANALVLGSFVRDRGVKKKRFKYGSIAGESNPTDSGNRSRRPTVAERAWGSDDDLFRDVGFGVQRDLREGLGRMEAEFPQPRPAGQVSPLNSFKNMHKWKFPEGGGEEAGEWRGSLATDHVSDVPSSSGPKKVTFFDVGGLLDDNSSEGPSTMRRQSTMSNRGPTSPAPALAAATNGLRRGSQALIQDLGGLFGPFRIDSGDKGKKIWSKEHTDTAASGMLGVELRDMSPAVSPCTEVPPILPAEPTHQAPGPPPYDDNSTTRRSEDVGGVRQV